ncbi:MAG: type II toxin-antitoxin system PemK/MazF family toxin [Sphingomonadales bacterium]|nr:type II toxin-antitoxin system PemK/MazF family toxin [Sphingomonadales bacterium]
MILQGDIWWADLADPPGSTAGYRRPVIVVQGDALNRSRLATVVCVPLTSNLAWGDAPGNLRLAASRTGLDRTSVAQTSLILAVDKDCLTERVGRISPADLARVLAGLDLVVGRTASQGASRT